jgi:hypothetical protein
MFSSSDAYLGSEPRHAGRDGRSPFGPRPPLPTVSHARSDGLDGVVRRLADILARRFHAPESTLLELATTGAYVGAARLEAMKLYAIAYEAATHGKLSPERAARVRDVFLPALREGRFYVELDGKPGAYASFDWQRRVLTLPPGGLNIDSIVDRGHVLHEAEHVIQAAQQRAGTRYEFEAEGHDAVADYVLHDGGATLEDHGGPRLDRTRYDELRALPALEQADLNRMAARLQALAIGNARAGRSERNGEDLLGLSADELRIALADWPGAAEGVTADTAFEEGYLRAQLVADPPRGEAARRDDRSVAAARHAALATPYYKPGLLPARSRRT